MGFLLCPDAIQLESAFELLLGSDSDGFDGKRESIKVSINEGTQTWNWLKFLFIALR